MWESEVRKVLSWQAGFSAENVEPWWHVPAGAASSLACQGPRKPLWSFLLRPPVPEDLHTDML